MNDRYIVSLLFAICSTKDPVPLWRGVFFCLIDSGPTLVANGVGQRRAPDALDRGAIGTSGDYRAGPRPSAGCIEQLSRSYARSRPRRRGDRTGSGLVRRRLTGPVSIGAA